jgi:hypothetical protein
MILPLPGLELQISKCSPKLVKNVTNYDESKFLGFYSSTQCLPADE